MKTKYLIPLALFCFGIAQATSLSLKIYDQHVKYNAGVLHFPKCTSGEDMLIVKDMIEQGYHVEFVDDTVKDPIDKLMQATCTVPWSGKDMLVKISAKGETFQPFILKHAVINRDSVLKQMKEDSIKYSHLFH